MYILIYQIEIKVIINRIQGRIFHIFLERYTSLFYDISNLALIFSLTTSKIPQLIQGSTSSSTGEIKGQHPILVTDQVYFSSSWL